MTDNTQAPVAVAADQTTDKIKRIAGGLNIALGGVLLADGIIIAFIAFCCLLMSFSLFFMAAIPAFFVTGFLSGVVFVTAFVNIAAGIGTVLTSRKYKKISKALGILTIVLDVAVIPANILALVCGAFLLSTEVNVLSFLIFIVAACAILLAVASLVLSAISIYKQRNSI